MAKDKEDKDYNVGYGKPPKKSQFQKGRSGNPNGRPKKSDVEKLNIDQLIREALLTPSQVTINGERVEKHSLELAFLKLKEIAFKGDHAALKTLIGMATKLKTERESAESPVVVIVDDILGICSNCGHRNHSDLSTPAEQANV